MDKHLDDEVLSELGPDRRSFIKRMVATAAFAAPFVASFDMAATAHADAKSPRLDV